MECNVPERLDFSSRGKGDSMVDVNDAHAALDFMYDYLRKQRLAPSDAEVRNISKALAQYRGPPLVAHSALEAFLAGSLRSWTWASGASVSAAHARKVSGQRKAIK